MSEYYSNRYQPTPIVTQQNYPYNQPPIIIQQENTEVQHGCHCLLCLLTSGLWAPFWIAACCGCCCRRPC
ncbi:hypothetical protein I4U23_011122 [Adineta vaga]|nr:hypothetical protein I4U23_011122 [Adineta vaga]